MRKPLKKAIAELQFRRRDSARTLVDRIGSAIERLKAAQDCLKMGLIPLYKVPGFEVDLAELQTLDYALYGLGKPLEHGPNFLSPIAKPSRKSHLRCYEFMDVDTKEIVGHAHGVRGVKNFLSEFFRKEETGDPLEMFRKRPTRTIEQTEAWCEAAQIVSFRATTTPGIVYRAIAREGCPLCNPGDLNFVRKHEEGT